MGRKAYLRVDISYRYREKISKSFSAGIEIRIPLCYSHK
ncbi:Uncharacterized protein dnm_067030 [Desulfonema magnum]|uniref:Uncharacterized protein n=1 Tax=Desulfonema magnum TaxID=45655 RepID=A0A975GR81_9BACT|nr:Uncharacterized protein dnm_067030 [Desulfonema magnum]